MCVSFRSVPEFLACSLPSRDQPLDIRLSYAEVSSQNLTQVLQRLEGRNIRSLDLQGNRLDDTCAEYIAYAVKTQNIGKVRLGYNEISDRGARALANAMRLKNTIVIEVHSNKIGPEGARSWVLAIVQTMRHVVDLSHNKLGNRGALLIADLLQDNHGRINKLMLTHNDIGFEGDRDLAEKVPKGITIQHRHKVVPFIEEHPICSLFLIICLFGFIYVPFMKCDKPIDGCEYTGKKSS
jgi:Leucine Rich Repeat (LRR) protein